MGEWRRCLDTPFYKNLDEGPSEFHAAFMDPVDLILVRTAPRRDGTVSVWRRQVLDVDPDSLRENFMKATAERMEAWVMMVAEASRLDLPGWKTSAMDDLDVDTVERDQLLDSLEVMTELSFTPVGITYRRVPQNLQALSRAVQEFGIGIC